MMISNIVFNKMPDWSTRGRSQATHVPQQHPAPPLELEGLAAGSGSGSGRRGTSSGPAAVGRSRTAWPGGPTDGSSRVTAARKAVAIRIIDSWESLPAESRSAITVLVERIQQEPPYSYKSGEIEPAAAWFPQLVRRARVALVAESGGRPVGYCVSLPVKDYGKLDDLMPQLPVDPNTTEYLAELGVDGSLRRKGVATALLDRLHEHLPAATTSVVIRTLTNNAGAIAFYQHHGYEVAEGVRQQWNGRLRLFLTRTTCNAPIEEG